jgi:hypothetical protein
MEKAYPPLRHKKTLPPSKWGGRQEGARKKCDARFDASGSFGVFGFVARPPMSPPAGVLSWNWLLVQSSHPLRYRLIGLASPLGRWTIYLGYVGFP